MASSRRTYDTDTITLRQVFAKNGNNSNIPALRVLTADGAGGTYWAVPSTLGVNPAFNQIITSAGTFTADLSFNTFRLLAGENMGMYGGPPGSNQTTLFAKAYSQIDISGENTLLAFANGNLDPSLKIVGEGGIQVRGDPATNTLFIDGPAPPIFVVSTGIYGFNQIKITEATSTITSSVQGFDGTFITADGPSTLLRFLGYNDIQLSTNTTTNSIYFTISTFTSKDYLNISNAAYSAYPSSISTVSSLYVRQDQFYSTLGFFSSQTGFNFSSVVSSINALAMSTGSNFYILSGLINERLTIAQFLQYQADDRKTLNSTMASTVAGLGTAGYLSTASMTSTVLGLGIKQTSTVIGLGTAGYLSTAVALVSSSQEFLTSSIIGLGTAGYVSTSALNENLTSTVKGLGTVGYISSLSTIITSSIFNTGAISTYDLEVFGSNTFSVRGNAFFRGPTNICTMTVSSINGIAAANFGGGGSGGTVGFPSSISTQYGSIFTTSRLFISTQNTVNIQPSTNSRYLAVGWDQTVPASSFVFSSSDGSNWSQSVVFNPYNRLDGGRAIAWNGTMWVAGGNWSENIDTGEIYPCFQYSTDGINWFKASDYIDRFGEWNYLVYQAYINDIKWNGNMWVAIGFDFNGNSNASLKYSYNGRTWSNGQGEGFNNIANRVAWDGTKWLAFGPKQGTNSNTTIKYSYNGINWSTVNQVALGLHNAGAWNGQMWVSVGCNGGTNIQSVSYSYDGFYWQQGVNSVPLDTTGGTDVAWNGSLWVLTGTGSNNPVINPLRYSTDGIYWYPASTITVNMRRTLRLLWSGTQWLTASATTNVSSFFTSPDGKFWQPAYPNSNIMANQIAFSSNIVPSYSQNGLVIFDSNVVNMFPSTNTIKPLSVGLTIDNILQINRSTNTVGVRNFNPEYTLDILGSVRALDANFSTLQKVSVNPSTNDVLVRAGTNNITGATYNEISRNNGSNWSRINVLGANLPYFNKFAWNGDFWVLVGSGQSGFNTIRLSYDLINWITPNMTQSDQFFSNGRLISWNGNMWVAFGTDVSPLKRTFYSYDAYNWYAATGAVFDFNAYAKDLKWDGTKWLVFGDQNNNSNYRSIQYSYDGKSWAFVQNVPFRNKVTQGVWNGSIWVCIGEDPVITSTIAYSSDGFNWSYADISFAGDYVNFFPEAYSVGWDGRKFLVSGSDMNSNNLLYSYNGREWFPQYFPILSSNIQWAGYRWIALVFYNPDLPLPTNYSSMVYSYDGFNWLNMGPQSMLDNYVNTLSYSSNPIPAYGQNGFAINTLNAPLNNTSTNNIQVLQSSMIINNTMYVDKRFNFVGINNPSPENPLDVFGGGRFLSLSTLNINISTINNARLSDITGGSTSLAGCNLVSTSYLNPSLASTVSGLGTSQYISSPSLTSTSIGLGTLGYISSPALLSTTVGVFTSGQSTSQGLSLGFVSLVQSTSIGLGTIGYLSSLDNVITRSFVNISLQSTTGGLGNAGYISTLSLTSSLNSVFNRISTLSTINASSFYTTNLIVSTISPMSVKQQGIYVAGGAANDSRSMLYSFNGINWVNTGVDFYCTSIVYTGTMFLATGGIPFKYSYDGITWYNASNTDNTILLTGQCVGWNGSYFVAGGQAFGGPAVAYSSDGINWTRVQTLSAFSVSPLSVAWNGRLWVMGGDSSNIYYSANGRTWTLATMPNNSNNLYTSIAWNGSYFMAVGGLSGQTAPQPAISRDGITWSYPYTQATTPWDGNAARSVIWDGSYWVVAVSRPNDSNSIFYTQDGITWGSNVSGMYSGRPTALLWDGNRYFCGGSNFSGVDLAYSTDFVNWSTVNITGFPTVGEVGALAFSSNTPVYKQSNLEITNGFNPTYYSSTLTNNISARLSSLNINNTLQIDATTKVIGVNCNAPRFTMDVAGSLNVSSFFINSFSFTNILTSTVAGIGSGGGGGGQTNPLNISTLNLTTSTLTSIRLTTSTLTSLTMTTSTLTVSTIANITVGPSRSNVFVAVGYGASGNTSSLQYSYDGLNWSNANTNVPNTSSWNGNTVAYNGTRWLTGGRVSGSSAFNGDIMTSVNGVDWEPVSTNQIYYNEVYFIGWNGQFWLAIGAAPAVGTRIKYSADGFNWCNITGNDFNGAALASAAWNGNMWVAVGADTTNKIKYSFDTSNWYNASIPAGLNYGTGVAWGKNVWVATFFASNVNTSILYSSNGTNWIPTLSGGFPAMEYAYTDSYGYTVAFNGLYFLAGGAINSALPASNFGRSNLQISYDGLNWSNVRSTIGSPQNIQWTGNFWIGAFFGTTPRSTIGYSYNGLDWFQSQSGGFSNTLYNNWGRGVGFSSNIVPAFLAGSIEIPQTTRLRPSNTIQSYVSSMVLNNILVVDRASNAVAINKDVANYTFDVGGSANVSSFFINGSTINSVISRVVLESTGGAIGASTVSSFSTLTTSSMAFVNVFTPANLRNMYVAATFDSTPEGQLRYSFDAITWNNATSGSFPAYPNGYAINVAWNGTMWVAVGYDSFNGSNGSIRYSFNGTTWATASGTLFDSGTGLAWNGRMWVATGSSASGATTIYSMNGTTWSNTINGDFGTGSGRRGSAVAWNGYMWLVGGFVFNNPTNLNIKYSLNGINFSNSVSGGPQVSVSWGGFAWNGKLWVAGWNESFATPNSYLKYSYDGLNWITSEGTGFSAGCLDVKWNGILFLAVGNDASTLNYVLISYDGIRWTSAQQTSFTSPPRKVIWNGTFWVASSDDNTANIKYSYDGTTWFNSSTANPNSGTYGLAFSSNANLTYRQPNLEIPLQPAPLFLNSTNQISMTVSSIIINNGLYVDRTTGNVGVNIGYPRKNLEVGGEIQSRTVSTMMFFTSTIGIGVSSPRYSLDILGNARISTLTIAGGPAIQSTNTDFALTVFATQGVARVGGTTWTAISDQRVKDNIVSADLERCYSDIKNIPLRRFTYTSTFFQQYNLSDKNVLGFIAQEVSTVQPKAITVSPGFGIQDMMWLNIDQLNMSLYGSVKKLIQDKESADSTIRGQAFQLETLNGRFNSMFSTLEGLQGR